jgi:uncharacterized protein YdcH (DUF465 family)
MKAVIKDHPRIMEQIHTAERGERIPVDEYTALKRERVRLCQRINARLAEINSIIRTAVANKKSRLPYAEYRKLVKERQSLREALKVAEWTLTNPLIKVDGE